MTYRIRGHREAGNGLPATEWPLLAAAGQPAEFHTRLEAERLVSMCNAALAHSPARITYAVEEAPEIRRIEIATQQGLEVVPVRRLTDAEACEGLAEVLPGWKFEPAGAWARRVLGLPFNTSASWPEEWPADDTGAPLTT